MAAPVTTFDDVWTAYTQAPPPSQHYDTLDPLGQYNLDGLSFPDAGPSSSASQDAYFKRSDGGGLRIDGYADPGYTFAPQRSSSHGTTPSPALPALSPASSISTSSAGFISPQQYFTGDHSPSQRRTSLLPAASIGDGGSLTSSAFIQHGGKANSFADLQETYLQHHSSQQPAHLNFTSYELTAAPSVPPAPSTPRRRAPTSSHLWRSPSTFSALASPHSSPYHRPTTPQPPRGIYPSDTGRRGSTGGLVFESPSSRGRLTPRTSFGSTQVDEFRSPTKSARRQARLSIEVPSYGASPSRAAPPPQPVFEQPVPVLDDDAGLSEASVREVEQLLGELGTILETGGSYQHHGITSPPPPLHQQRRGSGHVELVATPSSVRQRVPGGSFPMEAQTSSSMSSVFTPTTISISGVTLAEEDLALLDTPSLGGTAFAQPPMASHEPFPSSAPAWRTSFEMPPPRRPSQAQVVYESHYAQPPSSNVPPIPHYSLSSSVSIPQQNPRFLQHEEIPFRPSSAPRHHTGPNTAPPDMDAAWRRRNSVDSPVLAQNQFDSYSPYPPPSPSYTYSQRPQQDYYNQHEQLQNEPICHSPPPQQQQQQYQHQQPAWQPQPRQVRISTELPRSVFQPAQPPRAVSGRTTPPPSPSKPSVSPSKAPAPKSTPKRKRGSTAKAKPASAMFINFSAADSVRLSSLSAPPSFVSLTLSSPSLQKKLLSGVAPSGSTKKKREEEEVSERELGGGPAASTSAV